MNERGTTLIEVLLVMAIIGILANIAVPIYLQARLQAEAAAIVQDFVTFRGAVIQYNSDTGEWPPDFLPGREPPALKPYLEGKIDFDNPRYLYDWENWMLSGGRLKHPETGIRLGFSVRMKEPALRRAVESVWGAPLPRTFTGGVTFVIEGR